MAKRDKLAKWKNAPDSKKSVKIQAVPESADRLSPAWQFHKRDVSHAEWGWGKLSHVQFCDLLHNQLCNFETMTWGEIFKAVGDKGSGNMHHNISVDACVKLARERLAELHLDDVDEIFSLRLNNKTRLWGIKEGRVLRFIWYDAKHEICPSSR